MKRSEILKLAVEMASGRLSNPAVGAIVQQGSYDCEQLLAECVNIVSNVALNMGMPTSDPEKEV